MFSYHTNRVFILICLLIPIGLYCQIPQKIPSIEDQNFGLYFLDSKNIPIVKGKLLNYNLYNPDSINISYSVVTPFQTLFHISKTANLQKDGSFELDLDYAFPYQQIWLSIGNIFYAEILAHSDLYIELDAEKLQNKETSFIGDGVKYLGSDGELNTYKNNHTIFKRKEQEQIYRDILNLRRDHLMPFNEFKLKYDSLYAKFNALDDEFIKENPSTNSWLIKNERESAYYLTICIRNNGKKMDEKTWNEVKNHKSYVISNDGVDFYIWLYSYLSNIATKDILSRNKAKCIEHFKKDNRYSALQKNINPADSLWIIYAINNIEILDSIFNPSKADFLKMKIESKDVRVQKVILELIQNNTSTEWCKRQLNTEYIKTTQKLDSINSLLRQSQNPRLKNSDFGQSVIEFPFGAKLYTVNNISGSDLILKLKQTFNNKALLLEFWATWCGPCLQELKASKKLHDSSKDLAIEFIYLCTSEASTIEKWKSKIAELQIPGIHLYVNAKIEKQLMNLFSKNFPGYVFIDSKGRYIPDAIVQPSLTDKNKLKELIIMK